MSKYYVTMTDKFLSGWGLAKNKINKFVIECESMTEAQIVKENAKDRDDMKYVNITSKKPYYPNSAYFVNMHNKEEYESWFVEGFFRNKNKK